ncbi:hypothetical protein Cgig2_016480 [Carnegiea gigantea]|uniref:Uncharacterized protein n=1 Tax=Carnegiea gigantea TaxID=171969 RepID=A0A9Q1GJS1_9CARY|nr:hypothetical protein Cgig2_016480 [Carnegiea gigantea]
MASGEDGDIMTRATVSVNVYPDISLVSTSSTVAQNVQTMELRKHHRSLQNEVTYVRGSSSGSDDDNSTFDAFELNRAPSISLVAEVSGIIRDVVVPELQSKKSHDKRGSSEVANHKPNKRNDVFVIERLTITTCTVTLFVIERCVKWSFVVDKNESEAL